MDQDDYYYTLMLALRLQAAVSGIKFSVNSYLKKMAAVNSAEVIDFLAVVSQDMRSREESMYWLTPELLQLERTGNEDHPITNTEIVIKSHYDRFRLVVLVSEQRDCKLVLKHVQLYYNGQMPRHLSCVFETGNTEGGFFLKNHLRRLSPEMRAEAVKLLSSIAPHHLEENMNLNRTMDWESSKEAHLEMTQESWDLLSLAMFGLRND